MDRNFGDRRKRSDATRRRHQRWLYSLAVLVTGVLTFAPILLAVHDTGAFELEGDATNAPATAGDDWDNVCHQVTNGSECASATNTNGAIAVAWTTDNIIGNGPSLNATIFQGGGSKDPIDVSQWAWKDGAGGLPDKDNLLHSFAVRYSLPDDPVDCVIGTNGCDPDDPLLHNGTACPKGAATTCEVIYFGSDRYDNSGDAQQGFWFFQNAVDVAYDTDNDGIPDTKCPQKIGGGTGFCIPTGTHAGDPAAHKNGDLLVISDFSNGGTTSTITVYKWNNAVSGNLELLQTSDAANCATAAPGDAFCGIVNANNGTTSPWTFTDKSGNSTFLQGEFFEGGINLSAFPGLAGECFSTVASETRSSTSTTATLKDFVLSGFGKCESDLTTTPQVAITNGYADIATSLSLSGGTLTVRDKAVLTISGSSSWSGSMAFFLCEPTTSGFVPANGCESGGTAVDTLGGSAISGGTAAVTVYSVDKTISTAGSYCWRAEFTSSTTGVPDVKEFATTECFSVNAPSSISTTQSWVPNDEATITWSGGTTVTGTVRFRLQSGTTTCALTGAGVTNVYDKTFNLTTAASGVKQATDNTTAVTATASLSWLVEFSGDSKVDSSSSCHETTVITINNAANP